VNPSTLLGTLLCLGTPTLALGYLGWCRISPFRHCRACDGTGLDSRRRACRRCGATGLRVRVGTHLINEFMRIHRDGSR
jgi:hypothetical protein